MSERLQDVLEGAIGWLGYGWPDGCICVEYPTYPELQPPTTRVRYFEVAAMLGVLGASGQVALKHGWQDIDCIIVQFGDAFVVRRGLRQGHLEEWVRFYTDDDDLGPRDDDQQVSS